MTLAILVLIKAKNQAITHRPAIFEHVSKCARVFKDVSFYASAFDHKLNGINEIIFDLSQKFWR